MILLLPTKEYWFSKIERRLEDIANHPTFLTFQDIKNALVNELMHIETINGSDDINLFKRKFVEPLGAKLLEIDRMYGLCKDYANSIRRHERWAYLTKNINFS